VGRTSNIGGSGGTRGGGRGGARRQGSGRGVTTPSSTMLVKTVKMLRLRI